MNKWGIAFIALCCILVLYGLYDEFLNEDSVDDPPALTTRTDEIQLTTQSPDYPVIYTLNTSTKEIHKPGCSWIPLIAPENKSTTSFTYTKYDALADGYTVCEHCH